VGGDYYGYILLPGGRVAVLIGDVAGKGVPAALLMAKLASEARYCYLSEADPARALAHLNDLLTATLSKMDRFVTLCVVILEPATAQITMVSAGHGSPLLYRPGHPLKEIMPSSIPGMPLGIMEGAEFDSCATTLQPGDTVLMFTDGVNESKSVQEQDFGMEGIQRALKEVGHVGPKEIVERLAKAVKTHAAGRSPHDDVTVVALGRAR
jgi:serine phosphatase RsbU (regulator of sigma subunit)